QAEDGIRYFHVTGVQTCALPISDIRRPKDIDFESPAAAAKFPVLLPPVRAAKVKSPPTAPADAAISRPAAPAVLALPEFSVLSRSEERRVGKECRARGWQYHYYG